MFFKNRYICKRNFCFQFLIIYLLPHSLFCQIDPKIPRVKQVIVIDGRLNESSWQNAYSLTNFKQLEPNLGQASTEVSKLNVIYDDKFLYVGFEMNYKNSKDMYARTLERDKSLDRDDYVEIHIDTYNDHINTLVFRTNMLGAREDYEVSRNGETINTSWNTFWDVSTHISNDKWTAEFRIPFSSLRYKENENNTMRIKGVAYYKLKNERVISTLKETLRTPFVYQYRNSEEITFNGLPSSKPIYIVPYAKVDYLINNTLNSTNTVYEANSNFLQRKNYSQNEILDKTLSNIGVDIKYKPNSNHIIDVTLNTDFAEVEVDDRIINVSRFPIFLPEKRLFFLENNDLFNSNQFDHRLFFSRRIGIHKGKSIPIIGGVRFTGSNVNWQYGAFSMQTHSFSEDNLPSYNMSVFRAKKNIGTKGSYIGFIGTSKLAHNDYNYLLAIDGNIRFTDYFRGRFTLGSTFDKFKGNWKPVYGVDVNTFKANGFGINYRFRSYDENFNPELGFISRPNTKRITINHGWRKTYTNHPFLRSISIGNWTTRNWLNTTGQQDFSQSNFYFWVNLKNGLRPGLLGPIYQEDNLTSPWEIADNISIPAGKYKMWKVEPSFSTGNAFAYNARLDMEIGDFYGGKQFTISGNFNYDFSQLFSAEIGANFNRLEFPDAYSINSNNTLHLNRYYSRLKFSFSSKSFLNTYIQYDTSKNTIGWNIRYRYTPVEGTNLYAVFNQNLNTERNTLSPKLPAIANQIFTLKFSKTILK